MSISLRLIIAFILQIFQENSQLPQNLVLTYQQQNNLDQMIPYNLHHSQQSASMRPYCSMAALPSSSMPLPISIMKQQQESSQIPTNKIPTLHTSQSSPQHNSNILHENHPAILSKQHFDDLLTCQVCYCLTTQPHMCPHCSKLFCEQCIKKCLQIKPDCPHCRKNIKAGNGMANCSRFVNEIKGIFSTLVQHKSKQEMCEYHPEIKLDYFCQDSSCQIPVCHQCGLFGNHKSHSLTPLAQVYLQIYSSLRQNLTLFKTTLKTKEHLIKQIETQISELKKIKDSQLAEIQQWSNNIRSKIAQGVEEESKRIQNRVKELELLDQQLEGVEEDIKKEMERAIQDGSFQMTESVEQRVRQVLKKEIDLNLGESGLHNEYYVRDINASLQSHSASDKNRSNGLDSSQNSQNKPQMGHPDNLHNSGLTINNVLEQVIPPYIQNTFTVTDFTQKRRQKSMVFSPVVKIQGTEWRLKVYPGGSESTTDLSSYLSIFIQMVSSLMPHNPTTYEYQIQLIHPKTLLCSSVSSLNSTKPPRIIRQYSSTFEPGQCWGYNKYIKIENLLREGYVDEQRDQLTIKYYLRNPFYFNVYQQKEMYLQVMDNRILKQEEEIRQLEEVLRQEDF